MREHLQPCPFCGGTGGYGHVGDPAHPDHGGHFIQCTTPSCFASVGLIYACGGPVRELLAERWHRRATSPLEKAGRALWAVRPVNWNDDEDIDAMLAWRALAEALNVDDDTGGPRPEPDDRIGWMEVDAAEAEHRALIEREDD